MLCPEAETWTSFAGLSLATTADFFVVGHGSMLYRGALYVLILPHLPECIRNREIYTQQPELVS